MSQPGYSSYFCKQEPVRAWHFFLSIFMICSLFLAFVRKELYNSWENDSSRLLLRCRGSFRISFQSIPLHRAEP